MKQRKYLNFDKTQKSAWRGGGGGIQYGDKDKILNTFNFL